LLFPVGISVGITGVRATGAVGVKMPVTMFSSSMSGVVMATVRSVSEEGMTPGFRLAT
jgi:hypothetical protein